MDELRTQLGSLDGFDLASALGGLMVLPENSERLARLEAAAEVAASLSVDPGKAGATPEQLDDLLNRSWLASNVEDDDPAPGLFTKAVIYHGGSFVVFQGTDIEPAYTLSTLAAAISGGPDFPNDAFAGTARAMISAVLKLSDTIAARAGVARGTARVRSDSVLVPDAARLDTLRAAVTLTRAELSAMLGDQALLRLGPLISAFGAPLPDPDGLLEGALHVRPILLHADHVVVALPCALAAATVHAVLRLAQQEGLLDELARRARAVAFDLADRSLRLLDATRVSAEPWDVAATVRCGLYRIDTDAALVLYVAVDDLTDYDADEFHGGAWDGAQAALDAMVERQLEQERAVFSADHGIMRCFHLFALGGLGRSMIAGIGEPLEPLRAPRLVVSPSDIEVIAHLESGEPLSLWKYAEAQDRLRAHARVLGFGQLDEFAVYRKEQHSFYLDDRARPDLVTFVPGMGAELELAVQRKTDVHGAVLPDGAHTVEVRLVESDIRIPIYAPTERIDDTVRMLVEIMPRCWVICDVPREDMGGVCVLLTQAVAYWLWQFAPSAGPMLRRAVTPNDMLTVRLTVQPGPGWTDEAASAASAPTGRVRPYGVELALEPTFAAALSGSDNSGERILLRVLLQHLRARAAALSGTPDPATNVDIDAWIERHAPLGPKKKVMFLRQRQNFELIEQDLPDQRLLQEADESVALDELGPALVARLGLSVGELPDASRLAVLEAAVDWCFDELDGLVRTLDPREALPWLVAHHERLLEKRARERLTIPTRIACFAEVEDLVEEIARRREQLLATTLASRALIEYVTARPPQGLRPMSLTVYDRMLALAHEGIQRAIARDALQNDLSDEHLLILGSGRLGMTRGGRFEGARAQFMEVHTRAELARASEWFGRHWRSGEAEPPSAEFADVDRAAKAEFGITLEEAGKFLGGCIAIGMELGGEPKVMSRGELRHRLITRLGWSQEQVERGIVLFALEPRPDFWSAPPGFKASDVYMWRFNRPLSYIRRPLLVRKSNGGDDIVWGFRHVYEAGNYLVDLCRSGRLKATSSEMILAMTSMRRRDTAAFNQSVAQRYRDVEGLIVRTNVSVIAGARIERNPAEPLGDIDVLVIDETSRRVRLIESKDVAVARTPMEMGQQLRKLFASQGGEPAAAELHAERTEWVQRHLPALLAEHRVMSDSDAWRIEPLIVVDQELMTPFLARSPIPVVSWRDLPVP